MRRRWFVIVFGVSVALNLFFAGWYGARAFQSGQHRHGMDGEARMERPMRGPGAGGPRRMRQRARPFDWMSQAEREGLRPQRRELRGSRHAAEEALRAEPFDAEKLRQALAGLRSQTDGIQASVHELMLRRAGGMSAEERRRLADSQWAADGR